MNSNNYILITPLPVTIAQILIIKT